MAFHFQKSSTSHIHRYLTFLAPALQMRAVLGYAPPKNCLSFGCASGEEILTLRAICPTAKIHGCDISEDVLPIARESTRELNVDIFKSDWTRIADSGPYDLITANAVFCYHHQSVKLDDINPFLPFSAFEEALGRLVDLLAPGGLLLMRDATYPLACTSSKDQLIPLRLPGDTWSGLVEKFRPDGLKFGRRHQKDSFVNYEILRELPVAFEEALLQSCWIKRAEGKMFPVEQLRVTCMINTQNQILENLGTYVRDIGAEMKLIRDNMVTQTIKIHLWHAPDGTILQDQDTQLIHQPSGTLLFSEKVASELDGLSQFGTTNSNWIDTHFLALVQGQNAYLSAAELAHT